MYRSRRAKWIKIMVLISFFLSYLPIILFFNYLRTVPEFTAIFDNCVTCGNSIFFPWFSSINLFELLPIKEQLIPFSLGNLLDIILVCNLYSYFDGILYHYFVKRIITEREDLVEYDLEYCSHSLNNSANQKKFHNYRIQYYSREEVPLTAVNHKFRIQNRSMPSTPLKNNGMDRRKKPLDVISSKHSPSYIKIFSIFSSFYITPPYSLTNNYYLPSNHFLDYQIITFLLFSPHYSLSESDYALNFHFTGFDFFIIFVLCFKDKFYFFHPYYVHTITPNCNEPISNLEYHFTWLCEIPIAITYTFLSVIQIGIKQSILNLKQKFWRN
jgi:hypothetical protein